MKRNKLYILPLILSLFWGLTSCEDDSSIESAGDVYKRQLLQCRRKRIEEHAKRHKKVSTQNTN